MEELSLKPCPFCGGKAIIREYIRGYDLKLVHVECIRCEASLPRLKYTTTESAINAWNKRSDQNG